MTRLGIAFIGCVEFSRAALEQILRMEEADIVCVVTRATSAINSDFCSLELVAKRAGVRCFTAEGNDQEAIAHFIRDSRPDVIFCFGWSYLLRSTILNLARLGVIGYHPSALPRNRGRHPLIWAMVLGLTETASTFFFMDEGADSGDIISQKKIIVNDTDYAADLYERMTGVALEQIADFVPKLASGRFDRIAQDNSVANDWRKRSKSDGIIDWRMGARSIYNLVRALSKPYPGAHFEYRGREVKIWRSTICTDPAPSNLEPGRVLAVHGELVTVKCGEGSITVTLPDENTRPKMGEFL